MRTRIRNKLALRADSTRRPPRRQGSRIAAPAPKTSSQTQKKLEPESPPLSRSEMEERRFQAAEMFARGLRQSRVARELGVSRTSASRWYRMFRRGIDKLQRRRSTGRPALIPPDELQDLFDERASWTPQAFLVAIEQRFRVVYHRDHVLRLLKGLKNTDGLSKTRSVDRAAGGSAE